ncbi:MAG: hypothetical protein ABIJ00_05590 [Candidatus Eisenbacteria bacterium]
MIRIAAAVALVVSLACGLCWAGNNPSAKVAVHVKVHSAKQTCQNLPAISDSSEIITTYEGSSFDFFPVFFNLAEYRGVEYAMTWPAWTYSCSFTSCSDLVIGNVDRPGEGIAHAWTNCRSGPVVIPGWGWLYADSAGSICIIDHPGAGAIHVLDCDEGLDEPLDSFCAGVYGGTGDDPCSRGAGDGGDRDGEDLPALRIVHVIEVTDGTTEYMQPIWSPDGQKLAFTKPKFAGIYVRNADGSGPIKEVTSAAYSGYKPVWTSDWEALVVRTRTGKMGKSITSIDVETGETTILVEGAAHPGLPRRNEYGDVTFDIDGETMVLDRATGSLEEASEYYSERKRSLPEIYLKIDFMNKRMEIVEGDDLSRDFPHEVFLASLSPDRDRVAFLKGNGNIYVSSLDGSSLVYIGHGDRWDWSPDGKRLVFLGATEQDERTITAAELFLANADGTDLVQLSHTLDQVEDYPVWSPDGMRIAYSTVNSGKIVVAVLEEAYQR